MYDGVDQVILSVGLVSADASLFVDEIKYLLLVATPVEVLALGVAFDANNINGELTLLPSEFSSFNTIAFVVFRQTISPIRLSICSWIVRAV